MPTIIENPVGFRSTNVPPEEIEEYVGKISTGTDSVSIARIRCPADWKEPPQQPTFDEYTLVLGGTLLVEVEGTLHTLEAGKAIITHAGERVQYSTSSHEGADYLAVCLPAFTPEATNREE